jgi:hypothetical protein
VNAELIVQTAANAKLALKEGVNEPRFTYQRSILDNEGLVWTPSLPIEKR